MELTGRAMDMLTLFNQQVLQCQDDAFTLAWYLLGEEAEAEAVTQASVEAAFHSPSSNRADCRLLIFKQVVKCCHGRRPSGCGFTGPGVFQNLHILPEAERLALVLIDVLGLNYPEAACVIGRSLKETGRLLCQARRRLVKVREL